MQLVTRILAGVGIRMSWEESFLRINKGGTSIRDERVLITVAVFCTIRYRTETMPSSGEVFTVVKIEKFLFIPSCKFTTDRNDPEYRKLINFFSAREILPQNLPHCRLIKIDVVYIQGWGF